MAADSWERSVPVIRACLWAIGLSCVVLLGLPGCGQQASDGSPGHDHERISGERAGSAGIEYGQRAEFDNDVTVHVSTPQPFVPSDSAFPDSDAALAFEISVRNEGDTPYRLSQLAVSASADGAPLRELVDPKHGYAGIPAADRDVTAGRSARFTLAFVAPDEAGTATLSVQTTPELPATHYSSSR
ncbi:hypothetical protein [Haloechinothrix sp. LS1_15]|uniref:hypothetical protein n=1 Tax=Haloechinothrix sp. LS1_15 TaxID=2652248 RepID=UPI0029444315|nr:hypothetical protein [Haloechinothrix sp. LS1_15]MDV6011824.1 hypothetical protein [Haloechinothrix sp. LS1_15]